MSLMYFRHSSLLIYQEPCTFTIMVHSIRVVPALVKRFYRLYVSEEMKGGIKQMKEFRGFLDKAIEIAEDYVESDDNQEQSGL